MIDKPMSSSLLWTGFARSCECVPERPAIDVGREVTYREFDQRAKRLAATLQSEVVKDGVPLMAVFGYRSVTPVAAGHKEQAPGTKS